MEKRLGEFMLQGWALMGESCPEGCPCPLVFKKSMGVYKCVQCDQNFSGSPLANVAKATPQTQVQPQEPQPQQRLLQLQRNQPQPAASAPVLARPGCHAWSVQAGEAVKNKLASEAAKLAEVHDQDLMRKMLENINALIATVRELERL